jgi:LysR family glycine cleavage system transcriptional activator
MNDTVRFPSINALRTFVTVVQCGSFTEAAQRLNMTQSAISKQIRLLEDHYSTKLLIRSNRQLIVTESGSAILPHAHEIFEQLYIVDRQIKSQSTVLSLQVYVSFAVRWLMPRLGDYYRQHSHTQLKIETMVTEITDLAENNQLRILHGAGSWPGMKSDLLLSEQLAPVCSPNLMSGKHPIKRIEDLHDHTLFHTSADRIEWVSWLAAENIDVLENCKHQYVDLHHLAWTAAADNLGIAMGDMALIRDDLNSAALIRPFEKIVKTNFGYYLVYPEYYLENKIFCSFRNWLLDEVKANQSTAS